MSQREPLSDTLNVCEMEGLANTQKVSTCRIDDGRRFLERHQHAA